MKKGRRYIEPMTGRGDKDVKKRDIKKLRREAGKTFDGVSRPSNNLYFNVNSSPSSMSSRSIIFHLSKPGFTLI